MCFYLTFNLSGREWLMIELELTIVKRPDVRQEMRSFPALAHTIVLWAPDTAGPWSAVTIKHISINFVAYLGSLKYKREKFLFIKSPSKCLIYLSTNMLNGLKMYVMLFNYCRDKNLHKMVSHRHQASCLINCSKYSVNGIIHVSGLVSQLKLLDPINS